MPNELRQTVEMMNSEDYHERFKCLLIHEAHIICRSQL